MPNLPPKKLVIEVVSTMVKGLEHEATKPLPPSAEVRISGANLPFPCTFTVGTRTCLEKLKAKENVKIN
jgi:hypothetical protein